MCQISVRAVIRDGPLKMDGSSRIDIAAPVSWEQQTHSCSLLYLGMHLRVFKGCHHFPAHEAQHTSSITEEQGERFTDRCWLIVWKHIINVCLHIKKSKATNYHCHTHSTSGPWKGRYDSDSESNFSVIQTVWACLSHLAFCLRTIGSFLRTTVSKPKEGWSIRHRVCRISGIFAPSAPGI